MHKRKEEKLFGFGRPVCYGLIGNVLDIFLEIYWNFEIFNLSKKCYLAKFRIVIQIVLLNITALRRT